MADLNQWWRMPGDASPALDEAQVRRIAAELADLGVFWLEEPLPNLHVVAGVGGGPYVEFPYDPPGWTEERRDFFLAEPVRIDGDGCLAVPAAPGLGASIDPAAVARYALPA